MLGLALLFALMLDTAGTRRAGFTRLAIFLPYAMPASIAALLWGFLYLPGVSPFYFVLDRLGVPQPDLLDGGPRTSRDRQHRGLGRHRLQHDRHVHLAAGHPRRDVRGGEAGRRIRAADRLRIKIPMVAPVAGA